MAKKRIIPIAAYMKICPHCKKEAVIVTASGKTTKSFDSKKSGKELIELLISTKHLLKEEAIFLLMSLNTSDLDEEVPWQEEVWLSEADAFPDGKPSEDIGGQSPHGKWIM
jgi:hypothetical protein